MAIELSTHTSGVEAPEYLALKRKVMGAGLLSCSQRGFNIAMGPLYGLRRRIEAAIAGFDDEADAWEVPPLIRADWVQWKAWADPAEDEWCFEQPGGNILTPRPVLHLVNRLRHHPVKSGTYLLSGNCTRNEDADRTLPLHRQRTFRLLEYARVDGPEADAGWSRRMLDRLWGFFTGLDLHVQLVEHPGIAGDGPEVAVTLNLRAAEPVSLARSREISPGVREAYKLGDRRIWTVGIGPERVSLAIMARWGVDPASWPEIGRAE